MLELQIHCLGGFFFFSSRRRHTRSGRVTGVQTCALPIYLMASAIIKAFDDGIKRDLDPGEPEERNLYEAMEDRKSVV